MRVGRAIAAGTMALGAWRAYKEYKDDHPSKGGRRGHSKHRSRGRHQQKSGWFGTPFSIRH